MDALAATSDASCASIPDAVAKDLGDVIDELKLLREPFVPSGADMQFLVSDGQSFFHEERRDMTSDIEYLDEHGLAVRITTRDRSGRGKVHSAGVD